MISETSDVLCFGESNGSVVISVSGGTQPYVYLLNNPSETLYGISAGDYLIRVMDKNGCLNEQQKDLFESEINYMDALCSGQSNGMISVSFTGGTPYSIEWDTGQTDTYIDNLMAGSYHYIALDHNNCRIENVVSISEPDPLTINSEILPVSCVDEADGEISVTIEGGTEPYSLMWNNGATDEILNQLSGGDYMLTVTDLNNCH